jgi:long-subunit fatty acid transport protein
VLYDESPVPATTLRPSIPDSDRWAPTVGYGFSGAKWDIDFYYMPLFFDDATAVPGEDGVIAGEYSTTVQLTGITFNWHIG